MASYNKFNQFVQDLCRKKHDFSSDTFKVVLTNVAPVASNKLLADVTQIAAGNGYTSGGNTTTITDSINAGVEKVVGTNVVFTASGGSMAQARYAVLYNATAVGGPLIAWWDYGAPFVLATAETLTIAFDGTNGIFQIS